MEQEENQKSKNTVLKITVDILSVISLVFFFIICPIWLRHSPGSHDANGNVTPLIKLLIADILPSGFGIIWLLKRYIDSFVKIGRKYPFLRAWAKNPLYLGITICFFYQILEHAF
jgi:hypothetical protein